MLINEATDALFLKIASREDIDLAMTKGVNYPKGLLAWADEIGLENVLNQLEELYQEYGEDRYRPSPLLKRMVKESGLILELKKRSYYKKKSEAKREKKNMQALRYKYNAEKEKNPY